MLKTLNLTDSTWTVPYPHIGSIGHVVDFPTACRLASEHGYDAVNLDVDFCMKEGPSVVRKLLTDNGVRPGAFRFPVRITDEADVIGVGEFERGLEQFKAEAAVCAAAGFTRTAMHILPWSLSGKLKYGEHFRLVVERLKLVNEVLVEHDIKLGLEFLGSYGNRRVTRNTGQGYDFVHTVEGIRSLAAAAGAEEHVGLKLDVHHWWATGAQLEELSCLQPSDIVYVELNDSFQRPGGSKLDTPEFHREMPGKIGNSDSAGVLAVLDKMVGYEGPVVCEPFNRRMPGLPLREAVSEAKSWMDKAFKGANKYPETSPEVWYHLSGLHPYNPDPEEISVRAGGHFDESLRDTIDEPPEPEYTGEGGLAFSESNSEAAVISTMNFGGEGTSESEAERRKQIGSALVNHLHAFVKEVEPSQAEWEQGIKFLLEAGQWSHKPEVRHEWMLLSDTLGVTMLVDCLNHRKMTGGASTEWTVQGPFLGTHKEVPTHGANVCLDGSDEDPDNKEAVPALVEGRVVDGVTGKPVSNAKVDFWLTATNGKYAVQDSNVDPGNLCGYLHTDTEGSFSFKAIKPTPYKVPEDGPGGALMAWLGRTPWRPAHLHFIIQAPGYQKVITHLFVTGDPYLFSDAVFAVLDSLILDWPELSDEMEATKLGFKKTPFTKIDYTFKLAKE